MHLQRVAYVAGRINGSPYIVKLLTLDVVRYETTKIKYKHVQINLRTRPEIRNEWR